MKTAAVLSVVALARALEMRDDHCGGDNCARQVTGTRAGLTPIESRRADCSSFMRTTAVPSPVTVTVTVVPDGPPRVRRAVDMAPHAATVVPTAVPTAVPPYAVPPYASACSPPGRYSSACSCWGITAVTTTAPQSTVVRTVTATSDLCE